MSKRKYQMWFTDYFSLRMPNDAVAECYHSGECIGDCTVWAQEPRLKRQLEKISREAKVKYLRDTGAWDDVELANMPVLDLNIRLVWLAAAGLLMGGTEGAVRAMRPDLDMEARLVDLKEVMEDGQKGGEK